MDTRRDFMKKAMLLAGTAGLSNIFPESIQRAFAIDPELGSTYLDAEHVVILMQENRSFDHCFGTLQGVRGFNDPRAITIPGKNLVWAQTNAIGETYAPFRLNIKDSKITWMGALPHGRTDQAEANNWGKFNRWLDAKKPPAKEYAHLPLTMGYYTREDIPFNYALADAFTVCDQHFSSAMTSTYPNRSFLWTGTIREQQDSESKAHIRNSNFAYEGNKWKTFPERLEENGIAWKVYQNEIYCGGGFDKDEAAMLANLGCNSLEFFANYKVKLSKKYIIGLKKRIEKVSEDIQKLKTKVQNSDINKTIADKALKDIEVKENILSAAQTEMGELNKLQNNLSPKEKSLHQRAFTTNEEDPDYHNLTTFKYLDGNTERETTLPKGDLLHQFRQDASTGKLPTVSWLVAPAKFSDHPSCAWYGSWYVSEVLNILTANPEVWKKTIFILTYDENDGYFDHQPPFVAPNPNDKLTGLVSKGIDTGVEYIRLEKDRENKTPPSDPPREGPIGLGYRVPMVIASPWSRGGKICSQVFEHTSSLQFLEQFLNKKFGKEIKETNISAWRRTVSGDLTAAFSLYNGKKIAKLPFLQRDPFVKDIHKALFKMLPNGFEKLSKEEIEQLNANPSSSPFMPKQEPGIRPSCALPYQLYAEGKLSADRSRFEIIMEARNEVFGEQAAGSPFNVYAPGKYQLSKEQPYEEAHLRTYAVAAGDALTDSWVVNAFENELYHLRVYGPNGFFREYTGKTDDPLINLNCEYEYNSVPIKKLTGNVVLKIVNLSPDRQYTVEIVDNVYKNAPVTSVLNKGRKGQTAIVLSLGKAFNWYDFSVKVIGFDHFERRYAGRVETGEPGYSDPFMGRALK